MVNSLVKENRAGADCTFAFLRDPDRERVLLPVHQVGRRDMRPLVGAETPLAPVMVAVEVTTSTSGAAGYVCIIGDSSDLEWGWG